jgi:hypothetical protein
MATRRVIPSPRSRAARALIVTLEQMLQIGVQANKA